MPLRGMVARRADTYRVQSLALPTTGKEVVARCVITTARAVHPCQFCHPFYCFKKKQLCLASFFSTIRSVPYSSLVWVVRSDCPAAALSHVIETILTELSC